MRSVASLRPLPILGVLSNFSKAMLRSLFLSITRNTRRALMPSSIPDSDQFQAPASQCYLKAQQFLRGEGVDHRGRTLVFILAQNDEWLEEQHDFIQWLFPSTQKSQYNAFAPVLRPEQLALLGGTPETRAGLLSAYVRMLTFLGLQSTSEGLIQEISRDPWNPLPLPWLRRPDHNDLRITRMIACLQHAGLRQETQPLLDFLESKFAGLACKAESLNHWRNAVKKEDIF